MGLLDNVPPTGSSLPRNPPFSFDPVGGICRGSVGGSTARSEGRRRLERHPPPRDRVRQLQAARVQAQPSPAGVPSSVYVFARHGEVETPAVRRDELHN